MTLSWIESACHFELVVIECRLWNTIKTGNKTLAFLSGYDIMEPPPPCAMLLWMIMILILNGK